MLDTPIAEMALERGGHLRVGLEDFFQAESNAAEVERARTLAEKHGRPLATLAEAESMLGLPARRSR